MSETPKEELRKMIVKSLEKAIEKNSPPSRLVKTLIGVGVAYLGSTFDNGNIDEMVRLGGFAYIGWNLGGIINYFKSKSLLARYKQMDSKKDDSGCGCV